MLSDIPNPLLTRVGDFLFLLSSLLRHPMSVSSMSIPPELNSGIFVVYSAGCHPASSPFSPLPSRCPVRATFAGAFPRSPVHGCLPFLRNLDISKSRISLSRNFRCSVCLFTGDVISFFAIFYIFICIFRFFVVPLHCFCLSERQSNDGQATVKNNVITLSVQKRAQIYV